MLAVAFDRFTTEAEFLRDATGAETLANQGEDVKFSIRETGDGADGQRCARSDSATGRVAGFLDQFFAFCDRFEGGDELGGTDSFFQAGGCANLQGSRPIAAMLCIGECDDLCVRKTTGDVFQELQSIAMAKGEIEQKQIRPMAFQELDGGALVASGAADGKVRLLREDDCNPTTYELVVIDNEDGAEDRRGRAVRLVRPSLV